MPRGLAGDQCRSIGHRVPIDPPIGKDRYRLAPRPYLCVSPPATLISNLCSPSTRVTPGSFVACRGQRRLQIILHTRCHTLSTSRCRKTFGSRWLAEERRLRGGIECYLDYCKCRVNPQHFWGNSGLFRVIASSFSQNPSPYFNILFQRSKELFS